MEPFIRFERMTLRLLNLGLNKADALASELKGRNWSGVMDLNHRWDFSTGLTARTFRPLKQTPHKASVFPDCQRVFKRLYPQTILICDLGFEPRTLYVVPF